MASKRFRIEQVESQKASIKKKSAQELDAKLTKKLVNEKMYLYIDINAESGYKTMYECESSDEDDETQKIGRRYKCPNSKAISFLHKMKEGSRRKKRALSMVKDELKRSVQKLQKLQPKLDPMTQTKYRFIQKVSKDKSPKSSQENKLYKPKENKMLTLLNNSLLNELADKKTNYYTVESPSRRTKPSAQKRAEKCMQRIKMMLPSIGSGRRSVAF